MSEDQETYNALAPAHAYLVAIDPGSNAMGVAVFGGGVLVDTFTIKASAKVKDADERTWDMLRRVGMWRESLTNLPLSMMRESTLAYEDPVYMTVQGQARPISQLYRFVGHLDQWARDQGWKVYKYPVPDIKHGIVGTVSASKVAVETVLRHELNLHDEVKTEHEWDAIAVGIYHLQKERVRDAEIRHETNI